ncbi:MAG: phosphoglucosamine mutase [Galactobacillus timonensis]|jgi:phosphoglucosamine mutase|uniref:phosphoglucosamine mutase n=1 Tax=Galactobacillus timonensis TaxID=2041840 RepID=UPI000C85EF86|nr:phosphoglucosamine mutase [Galactobacillus timonensis]MCI6067771.1 phosphoglucosamine mutase [Galactobacillus timonensis]MCI6753425.1 phosphoglucosamine mutase [Galactobacillus timonensis]MDD7086882.1 phosphoglucosamine mutase [Galactobacillus timonensis]MDY5222050.1 phosphoglucosamine mutase [Lachnospiraceae bacterium]
MGKYFGTDGIRGRANEGLTADRAFLVGRSLGEYFSREGKKKIVIGKDTRLSSDMLEAALAAGIASEGCDAYLTGYGPTPMICWLTVHEDFACGAMISASHNPYFDNGIKVFSKEGIKIPAEIEDHIEDCIDGRYQMTYKINDEIGKIFSYPEGVEHYIAAVEKMFAMDLKGFRVAMDCANGSSSFTAERVFKDLGADVTVHNHEPNGININNRCGSTHPADFQEFMKANQGRFDLGLTFDGDADRQILVRPDGELVDGDYVLYIAGRYLKDHGMLNNNTIVTTVMANLGLWKAMEANGIEVQKTQVGDKYVYDCMCKGGFVIGGEQSGHIIFSQVETTGDGLVTALMITKIMRETGKTIDELCEGLVIYPQVLVNVPVTDKEAAMKDPEVLAAVEKVDTTLKGNGRVLVRASGTEPLVRVMAEAQTDAICQEQVDFVADIVRRKYGTTR